MKKHKSIRSLKALHEEKERIRLEMAIAKNEFVNSGGKLRSEVQHEVFNKVLLPLGIAGATTAGYKLFSKLRSDNNGKCKDAGIGDGKDQGIDLTKWIPVVVALLEKAWMWYKEQQWEDPLEHTKADTPEDADASLNTTA